MVKLRNKNNNSIGVATNLEDNVAAEEKDGVPYSQRHWGRQYGDKHHHEPPERHQPHVHVEAFDVVVQVGEVLLDEVVEDALVDADTEHVWVEVGGEDELHAAERATRCVCVCVCVCAADEEARIV